MIGPVTITDFARGPEGPRPSDAHGPHGTSGRRSLWLSLGIAAIIAALGPGLGWLWAQVAPRVLAIRIEGGFAYAEEAPEQAVAADGWFALLGTAAGVVIAVAAWVLLRRHRGVSVLIALTAGSLVAAYLAWRIGDSIGQAELARAREAAIGAQVEAPLRLRATGLEPGAWWRPYLTGVAATQALAAAVVYTTLAAFSSRPDLRPPDPDAGSRGVTGPDPPAAAGPYPPQPS